MKKRNGSYRTTRVVPFVLLLILCAVNFSAFSKDAGAPNEQRKKPTTAAPVEAPAADDTPAPKPPKRALPTDAPAEPVEQPTDAPAEPVEQPTEAPTEPIEQPTEAPTEEVVLTVVPQVTPTPDGSEGPHYAETFCRMDITNGGDSNPFSYGFTAAESTNIASYLWEFGDGATSSAQSPSHTYAGPGTYNVTLTCNPTAGFGDPLVLNGVIRIDPIPAANFELLPGYVVVADVGPGEPVTITTVNQSTPAQASFAWTVRHVPSGTVVCTSSAYDFSCGLEDYGEYTFELVVTIGASTANRVRSVVVNAPAPSVDFTLTPSAGGAPLEVTVEATDLDTGPLTSVEWDFNYDGTFNADATGLGPHTTIYTSTGQKTIRMNYSGPGGGGFVEKTVFVTTPDSTLRAAFDFTFVGNAPGGGVEVCFVNLSEGPYDTAEWDFDGNAATGPDGYETVNNSSPICRVYNVEETITIRLRISNASSTSQATKQIRIVFGPVANFTYTPTDGLTVDTEIDFINQSTGVIYGDGTGYAWDFNGDGIVDSTLENPQNIQLSTLGPNPIRLTVYGPGGSSFVEHIIMVAYAAAGCEIAGSFTVTPGSGAQTYGVDLSGLAGRTVTAYAWSITGSAAGLPITSSGATVSVDWNAIGQGTFVIALDVTLSDGSVCSDTATVSVVFPPIVCDITHNLPGTLYPNGQGYTFNGVLTDPAGRTVVSQTWTLYQNGAEVATGSGTSFDFTNVIDASLGAPINWMVRWDVTVSDGGGATSFCFDDVTFQTLPYPTAVCAINGPSTPRPNVGAQSGLSDYSVNVTDAAGRPIVVDSMIWTVGPNGTLQDPQGANPMTVLWQSTMDYTYATDVSVTLTIQNADGSTATVTCSLNITVTVQRLVCNAPSGDPNPVVGEVEVYTSNIVNVFGRAPVTTVWRLTRTDVDPNEVVTQIGATFSYEFTVPDATYTLSYTAVVPGMPPDNCASPAITLSTHAPGLMFNCDVFMPASGGVNNANPTDGGATYVYSVDIDNGNALNLRYTWALIGPNGEVTEIHTAVSSADGAISTPPLSFDTLSPSGVGVYTLRVRVEPAPGEDGTDHLCALQMTLTVGAINALYTYVVTGYTHNAVPVGEPICIANASTATGDASVPAALTYTWTIGGDAGQNSLGVVDVAGTELPDCFSFNTPGSYVIRLAAENSYDGDLTFRLWDDYQLTFNVYGRQSISINRENESYAPSLINFTANGNNIDAGSYRWQFFYDGAATPFETSTQQNPTNISHVNPGTYRARVTGQGPLGEVAAEITYTLVSTNAIAAAFRIIPQSSGVAPYTVCFVDRSAGLDIVLWEWDFTNDGTIDATFTAPGGQPCYTYQEPGQVYTARLRVFNGLEDEATNTIRTFTLTGASASFSIEHQGGGYYCFTPLVSDDVVVVEWDFGDGSTTPGAGTNGTGQVCHAYTSIGDNAECADGGFPVDMIITFPGGSDTITRCVMPNFGLPQNPELTIAAACTANGTATFTVTNTGTAGMQNPDQIVIRDPNGGVLLVQPVLLGPGASADYSVSGVIGAITGTLTDNPSVTATTTCIRITLDVSAACAASGLPAFIVTKQPAGAVVSQPYVVTDGSGNTIMSGTFTLEAGVDSVEIAVPAGSNPFSHYTFASSGTFGALSASLDQPCISNTPFDAPDLRVTTTCAVLPSFTVTNAGGPMTMPAGYRIVHNSTQAEIDSGSIQLGAAEATTITLAAGSPVGGGVTFVSDEAGLLADTMTACATGSTPGGNTPGGGTPFTGLTLADLPTINTCGRSCPVFRVYHTDENGGWEIFRLDGANEETRTSVKANLSFGLSSAVEDSSPSLSPNNEWVVFQSNRDGNWELYVAPTSGGSVNNVTRLTHNTVAHDTDPVWGPNNFVVFETTRHGNWDLYAIDMTTGAEYRLTDSDGSDINPYWSPDGSRLVFQSDRADESGVRQWQVYELNLNTRRVTKLSDGSAVDVEPQYSNGGDRIAYRTYAAGAQRSQLALMNADGSQRTTFSDDAGDATNIAWSPSDTYIAYQSDLDGDLDVYVYDIANGQTRQMTDNEAADFAPTWLCGDDRLVFTSEVEGDPQIFEADVTPISRRPLVVEDEADQMTFEARNIYPLSFPAEENASREGLTVSGRFGAQTSFLNPAVSVTRADLSTDGLVRTETPISINACEGPPLS